MLTEYMVSHLDAGASFPEVDGFLLSLIRSRAPETQAWTSGDRVDRVFELRDDHSPQALFRFDTHYSKTPLCIGGSLFYASNVCLPFSGVLHLVSVPHGAIFEIVLSDVYVPPRVSRYQTYYGGYTPTGLWASFPDWRHGPQRRVQPPPLELAPLAQIEGPERELIPAARGRRRRASKREV